MVSTSDFESDNLGSIPSMNNTTKHVTSRRETKPACKQKVKNNIFIPARNTKGTRDRIPLKKQRGCTPPQKNSPMVRWFTTLL